jgi:TPR repeat protein
MVKLVRRTADALAPPVLALLLALAPPASVLADYREGMAAWDRGDLAGALAALREAAEAGDPRAQDQLGIMFEEGQGVARDDVTAVFWYEKAAEQGYAPAQLNLGRMYRNGKGVEQDEAQAVRWYERAARQGLAIAQFFLGLMYDTGKGVTQDPVAAYMWFSLAAAQGDQDAAFKRDRIAARLSADQIAAAHREGEGLGPMSPAPDAAAYVDTRPPT